MVFFIKIKNVKDATKKLYIKSKKSKKKVEIVKKSADKPEKIKKPTKPKLRKKDEPVEIVYTECSEELTEEPYIE